MRIYSEMIEMCRECPAFWQDDNSPTCNCSLVPNKEFIPGTGFPDFCPLPEDPEYPDDKD